MADTQHTPTPWSIKCQEDLDPEGNGYIWAIKGKRLSEEKNTNGGWKHYVQNPAVANSEANARLIASAPVMLDALENILLLFANCDDGDNCNCYERTQMIAEQAIVKAKGE